MRILAIETSCDETAIAVLEAKGTLLKPDFKLLGNVLNSQIKLHEQFGGVVPDLAKREHQKNLPILLDEVLKEARSDTEKPDIDVIAVTAGPGLAPALWAGITFAEELGKKWQKPVVPVNHMEGHILSVLWDAREMVCFPALALLVSGGHTELVLVKDFGNYEVVGKTRDDAVGEAFDKVARLLGLSYPGGPKISSLAETSRASESEPRFIFPKPMINSGDLNFSYSGLKTSVLYKLRELGDLDEDTKRELARAFEDAAIDVLVQKTKQAIEKYGPETLIIGGGVSANIYLRREMQNLAEHEGVRLLLPDPNLSVDNAVMIAIAGFRLALEGGVENVDSIQAKANLSF